MSDRKLARDIKTGDRVQVTIDKRQVPATVMAVVESIQIVRKKVLTITLRDADGRDTHRHFYPMSTFRMLQKEAS